jgi:hypothetical protein
MAKTMQNLQGDALVEFCAANDIGMLTGNIFNAPEPTDQEQVEWHIFVLCPDATNAPTPRIATSASKNPCKTGGQNAYVGRPRTLSGSRAKTPQEAPMDDRVAAIIIAAIQGAGRCKDDLISEQITRLAAVILKLEDEGHPLKLIAKTLRSIAKELDQVDD